MQFRDYTIDFTRADEITGFLSPANNEFKVNPNSQVTINANSNYGIQSVYISYKISDTEYSDYKTLYYGETVSGVTTPYIYTSFYTKTEIKIKTPYVAHISIVPIVGWTLSCTYNEVGPQLG